MSNDIEKIPLIFIINGSHIDPGKELSVNSADGVTKMRKTFNISGGTYDIFLDNLTTLNASHAENINTMAFSTILSVGNPGFGEITKSIHIVSDSPELTDVSSFLAAQGNTIIVPNESNSGSDVCVCHKARKMNYVGMVKFAEGITNTTFSFSITFLNGVGSIFKTDTKILHRGVIAEYILVRRKE